MLYVWVWSRKKPAIHRSQQVKCAHAAIHSCMCACVRVQMVHCNHKYDGCVRVRNVRKRIAMCAPAVVFTWNPRTLPASIGKTQEISMYICEMKQIDLDSRIYNLVSGMKKEWKKKQRSKRAKKNDNKMKDAETVNERSNKILTVYWCVHKFSVVLTSVQCVCVLLYWDNRTKKKMPRKPSTRTHKQILYMQTKIRWI